MPRNRPVISRQYGLVSQVRATPSRSRWLATIAVTDSLLNIHSMLGIVLGGVTSEMGAADLDCA